MFSDVAAGRPAAPRPGRGITGGQRRTFDPIETEANAEGRFAQVVRRGIAQLRADNRFNTRMRYVRLQVALWAICSLLVPAAAHGQADAEVDPDSPAGVEYELPLEQARKNAKGGGKDGSTRGDRAAGGGGASLFGAGIVPVKASRSGVAEQRNLALGAPSRDSDSGGRGGPDGAPDGATVTRSTLGAPDADEGSAALRIAGIALAVLLVGGLLGLLLRRGLSEQ